VSGATLRVEAVSNEPSEADLIGRTLSGDGSAYGQIVSRFQKKIFRVAYAILRDEMEADLVTQDTFVQAYTHLGKFEGRSGLETWLTRIAINRSRDSLRKKKWISLTGSDERGDTQSLDVADSRPDAESVFLATEISSAIERAVELLSAQQKVVFRLRHYEDFSLEDIAAATGLRPGTVRAHLFRAVHKVRKELAGWWVSPGAEGESA